MKQHLWIALCLVLALLWAPASQALQDPTRPPGAQRAPGAEPMKAWQVDSIFYSTRRKVVVIEGVALREGERHRDIQIRRIDRDKVEILESGYLRTLYPAALPDVRNN
ncbi:hypothetical protein C7H09_14270 [Marinobacter fuscus]|uniref:MSHA biogenesis protein MshK n=1 Tax=Marinobacter fuscus TaxID=2109942 RepID=A0A2T1K5X5_9GAMM|nr:hypothetical protein [Marinobacter fuscus]PSF05551.1 hypothetical protein C7H09_14270 [Marinobacter fuscus]